METRAQRQVLESAPYYIRWNPDQSLYAIELKLDLVARIAEDLSEASKLKIEIGGVLIGSFPDGPTPIMRIEELEIIPRRPEDGPVYMLDPIQHQRFAQVHAKAKQQKKVAVGFFRSHIRPGPLRPSLADRSLLSGQFGQAVYALLLIQAREPRTAALFISTDGQLSDEPVVQEFRFDEAEFKALPEVEPDTTEPQPERISAKSNPINRWLKPIAVPLLIAVAVLSALWWLSKKTALLDALRPSPDELQLAVNKRDHLLRISWNHNARDLDRASGATLLIADGSSRQEIKLGPDELKLGAVEYQPNAGQIHVTMTLTTAGSPLPAQSIDWQQK